MPIYEYLCDKCGTRFETIQKFSDDPLKTHEGCGGEVERLLSAPAFHLKGSGWYATDYAKAGSKPKENKGGEANGGAEKSDSKGGATGDTKKADSTPAPASTPSTTPSSGSSGGSGDKGSGS